ncbi:MAG: ABC transporter permease [Deltaproteobacteria bacterium]|nr:ABC transporter permease [Deltaproteobacteria bacterium]
MIGTLTIAWRNLWRTRRRTVISMSAIGLGLALVVIYGGLVSRLMGDAKEQLDTTGLGHFEVTAAGWRQHRSGKLTIADLDAKLQDLPVPASAEVSVRVLSRGLLAGARGNEAVEVHGVDWQRERAVALYLREIRQGAVPADDDAHGILVGEQLAERLKLQVGHKLRLTVQRADGEMGAALFRVRGVFHTLSPGIGQRRVLISRAAAAELLGVGGSAHQIVVQIDRAADASRWAGEARAKLGPTVEVLTYADIYPIFEAMESLVNGAILVGSIFVYFLVGLGILNTMLMSVLERTREFGVMQALGTRPGGVLRMVLAESFWIATLSVALGLGIGLSFTWLGSRSALLDFSEQMGEGIEFGGTVMRAAFLTEFSVRAALLPALYVYLMALLVALYPAWRVSRMRPVDALRAG